MEVVREGGRHGSSKGGVGDMEVVREGGRHGSSKAGWETWR